MNSDHLEPAISRRRFLASHPVTDRRAFVGMVVLGIVAPPLAARAQEPKAGKVWRIGFDTVVNLRTAKTLRLTIPPKVLLRANTVIE